MNNEVGINFNIGDVQSFQSHVTEPFYTRLKENIQNRFTSQDLVSCFSIFNPRNVSEVSTYGEDQVRALSEHYRLERCAKSVLGEEFVMPPVIASSQDLPTEWKTFRRFLITQSKEDIGDQLKKLSSNSMMKTMFPNLCILANVCLSIPVGNASVERSFFHMKMIKSRLRNRLGETNLSHLMKIALESPEVLSEEDLEHIMDVWMRKQRRVAI